MVKGIEVDRAKVSGIEESLMRVTALAPKVGMTTRRRLRTRRMWSIRACGEAASETGTSYGRGIRCAGEAGEDDASVENRLLS